VIASKKIQVSQMVLEEISVLKQTGQAFDAFLFNKVELEKSVVSSKI